MSDFQEIAALEGDLDLAHVATRKAERQRDQLLEAIEAHRAEKAHGLTANMDLIDDRLYELADQIKSTSKVASDGEDASKARETCEGPGLHELLRWAKQQAEASDVLHDFGIKCDDRDATISHGAAAQSFREVANRIHELQANEEKGGEG